jgi:hypothetical protein
MSDEPAAPAPPKMRHYRYIGETDVVMPALMGRDRCCQPDNKAPHADETLTMHFAKEEPDPEAPLEALAVDAHVLLRHGDVILLDEWSGEGRADFERADAEPVALADMTKAQLLAYAAGKGIDVAKGATNDAIRDAIREAEAQPPAGDDTDQPPKEA